MEAPKPKRRRKPVAEAALTQRVNISAPYAGEANGYQVRRLDATLDARQRRALRLIFDGLEFFLQKLIRNSAHNTTTTNLRSNRCNFCHGVPAFKQRERDRVVICPRTLVTRHIHRDGLLRNQSDIKS